MKENKKGNEIFGINPIIEAIKSGKTIDKLFIKKGLSGSNYLKLKKLVDTYKVNYSLVPLEKLNRFTKKNHQGVFAFISPIEFYKVENILPQVYEKGQVPLFLILDRITDVRNFGAISRTAECAGVHAIIIPYKGSAPLNADTFKTSVGALYKIPICRELYLKDTIEYLQNSGVQVVSCTEKAENLYYDIDLSMPTAIIMGSECTGISLAHLAKSDKLMKIPMYGNIESLNVSVACGIVLYETLRHRKNNY